VTFLDGATTLGTGTLSGSVATFSTSSLSSGVHSITASYGGDGNNNTSTSAVLSQTIKADTTTTVTSGLNPSTSGQSVTFTAVVTPSGATGNFTFFDGAAVLGTVAVSSGSAQLSTTTLTSGTHSITAAYNGDNSFSSSTSAVLTQIVKIDTTTVLTSDVNPSSFGQSVTFTVTVSPAAATGSVTFFDGATSLGTVAISAGSAQLSTSALAVGSHFVIASYSGNANYNSSTSVARTQTVNKGNTSASVSSSANPSLAGQSVTFTALVSPATASGTVTFLDGATVLGSASLSGGAASFSTSGLPSGSHSITVSYGGDGNFNGSTSALTQVVKTNTTTALASNLNPSVFGQSVTFRATVSAGATGTVSFFNGATLLGSTALSAGSAAISTSTLAGGSHSITATYNGDSTHNASTSTSLSQTVNKASTTTTLVSDLNPASPSDIVTFTATISPATGTGVVTFLDDSTTMGTGTVTAGVATFSTTGFSNGSHSITAVYGGDGNYNGSTSPALTEKVNGH